MRPRIGRNNVPNSTKGKRIFEKVESTSSVVKVQQMKRASIGRSEINTAAVRESIANIRETSIRHQHKN